MQDREELGPGWKFQVRSYRKLAQQIILDAIEEQWGHEPTTETRVEVELLRNNPEFMGFLKKLSQEEATVSLEDLRKELAV